jgi:hypothetical protein
MKKNEQVREIVSKGETQTKRERERERERRENGGEIKW